MRSYRSDPYWYWSGHIIVRVSLTLSISLYQKCTFIAASHELHTRTFFIPSSHLDTVRALLNYFLRVRVSPLDPPPPPPVQCCGVEEKLLTELFTLTALYNILEQRLDEQQ